MLQIWFHTSGELVVGDEGLTATGSGASGLLLDRSLISLTFLAPSPIGMLDSFGGVNILSRVLTKGFTRWCYSSQIEGSIRLYRGGFHTL